MSKKIEINIPTTKTSSRDDIKYSIVRTYSAGVFAGYLAEKTRSKNGKRGIIKNSRRLWYWYGAASLSQLAIEGLNDPGCKSKFPCEVETTELMEIIEVIECTEKAMKSIKKVPIWKM